MTKITSLIKTMNFRKLLIAGLPVITAIILSVTLGVAGECSGIGSEIVCW
jgi:hypothetical protein